MTSVKQTQPELRRLGLQASTGEEAQITLFPQALFSALFLSPPLRQTPHSSPFANFVWVSSIQTLLSTLPSAPAYQNVPTSKANSLFFFL